MPEILRLRSIPVVKKSTLSEDEKRHYTSIATSTRHLMLRLCNEGLIAVDREQISFWSLRFTLTPAGLETAKECEEFLSYILNLQTQITLTLESRSQSIHDLMLLPAEKVPGDIPARHSPNPPPAQTKPKAEPRSLAPEPTRSEPKASPKSPPPRPKMPATEVVPPMTKASIPAKKPSSIAPHPAIIGPSRPVSRMLRCPKCQTEFPYTSVKRQVDRHDNFECDTCGMDLTNQAYALIEGAGVGAG